MSDETLFPSADIGESRRRLETHIEAHRELLRRIDDATLAAVMDQVRSLVADPNFDVTGFLASWLFMPVPSLDGVAPADVLTQRDGLARVSDVLGRWVHGTYA